MCEPTTYWLDTFIQNKWLGEKLQYIRLLSFLVEFLFFSFEAQISFW